MKKFFTRFSVMLFTLLIITGCATAPTASISVEEAQNYPRGGRQVLLNWTFDSAQPPVALPEGYSIVRGVGVNGTSALRFARQSNKVGEYIAFPLTGIEPGVNYMLRLKIKGDIVNAPGSRQRKPVVCGIEYRVNGQPREVLYPLKPLTGEYQEFTFQFMARPNGYEPHLVLYLWHDWSGEIFFDDVEISSEGQDVSARIIQPGNLTFRNGDTNFTIHVDPRTPQPAALLVSITQNGKTESVVLENMDENFCFKGEFSDLVPGKAEMTIKVLDMAKKLCLYTATYQMNVLEPDTPVPANAALFDEYGRLIVDGKPFMVLGVYGMFGEIDIQRVAAAGFNTLHLYASLSLRGNVRHADVATNMREGLDLIHKYNLRLLFSTATQIPDSTQAYHEWDGVKGMREVITHAVQMTKDHPALLGWYISDECSRDHIPYLQSVREQISAIDPWHPVWTLTYRTEDMPLYHTSGDVFGIDNYPIDARAEKQSLDKLVAAMQAANLGGIPVWMVPQIFNWEYHAVNPQVAGTRGPNRQELIAMPLLGAIMGARGFVFFSYTSLFLRGERLIPGSAARDWPAVVEMVQIMKSLEKFIMSKEDGIPVEVIGTDRVMAKLFQAEDGEVALVAVALGPDPVKATIKVPEHINLKSRFGLTRKTGPGLYEFTAGAIDADILDQE